MAVSLNDMLDRTKVITVKWDGEEVEVSYFVNRMTPDLMERVEIASREDNLDVLGVMLEPILDWWDILEADGSRLPTDSATIKRIPMSFLNALQEAIQEEQNPPESSSSAAS